MENFTRSKVEKKEYYDKKAKAVKFQVNDLVFA